MYIVQDVVRMTLFFPKVSLYKLPFLLFTALCRMLYTIWIIHAISYVFWIHFYELISMSQKRVYLFLFSTICFKTIWFNVNCSKDKNNFIAFSLRWRIEHLLLLRNINNCVSRHGWLKARIYILYFNHLRNIRQLRYVIWSWTEDHLKKNRRYFNFFSKQTKFKIAKILFLILRRFSWCIACVQMESKN